MTIDELSAKIDQRFDKTDDKLDEVVTKVAVHSNTLEIHDRENKEFKERINKLEKIVWTALGSGLAAGTGIAKLFL